MEKLKIKLNVKDQSVYYFLKTNLIGYDENTKTTIDVNNTSTYHLIKNEMYFKKELEIKPGDIIKIELKDFSYISRKDLINIYFYLVENYDDVSIKLTLIDFKIKLA